jgi:hypothetical protein
MFSNSDELTWLSANQTAALAADTWDAFCDGQGGKGNHYRKYGWLRKHWEFLKARGFLMVRTIQYPNARAYTDLFTEARIATKSPGGDWYYLAEHSIDPGISGSYGGKRGWADGRGGTCTHDGAGNRIRSHYGATYYSVYVRVRPDIKVPQFFDSGKSSLQAIRHDNGKVLITAESSRFIGSAWLAYLDGTDSLESLLSPADQEFLARERAAEVAAWGEC